MENSARLFVEHVFGFFVQLQLCYFHLCHMLLLYLLIHVCHVNVFFIAGREAQYTAERNFMGIDILVVVRYIFSVSGFQHFIRLCNRQVCVNLILALLSRNLPSFVARRDLGGICYCKSLIFSVPLYLANLAFLT